MQNNLRVGVIGDVGEALNYPHDKLGSDAATLSDIASGSKSHPWSQALRCVVLREDVHDC